MTPTSQEEAVEASAGRKQFVQFAAEQRRGAMNADLSDALAELVQTITEVGGKAKGSLTLKLDVSLNKDGYSVTVSDEIVLKLPKKETPSSLFFFDEHGNVSRNNPRQQELPLRAVDSDGVINDNDAAAAAGKAG